MKKCEAELSRDEIDIPSIKKKYREQRDLRLRDDALTQYVEARGEYAGFAEVDPFLPVEPREPLNDHVEVVILGTGFAGTLSAVRLRQVGIDNFRMLDLAGDFGGVWYWNRYPGIQCDNESYCYLPLLEETGFMPSKRFSDGWEIREHCQRIGRQFALYEKALFHTLIRTLRWDEALKRWHVGTNRDDDLKARFVILCSGPYGRPKLAGIPGLKDYRGRIFHSARWDYDYTGGTPREPVLDKLADRRVAIIGTGASAVQITPYLGKYAKHLHVFQRTPAVVSARHNTPTAPEWVKLLQPGWQKERQRNYHTGALESFARGEDDLVCDLFTVIARNVQARREAMGWPDLPTERLARIQEEEDYRVMERIRERIGRTVRDPATAEALKPWYRYMCKRPLSSDDYLETFNRSNVTLVDVSASKGVERMVENGLIANGTEYDVDCIILASGFEVTTGIRRRLGIDEISGRDGLSLYAYWQEGLRTFHGLMSHDFPNLFFTGYTQAGIAANVVVMFQRQCNHIAHVIAETLRRGAKTVQPTRQAEDGWVKTIRETAVDMSEFQRECTPGFYNSEGVQSKSQPSYLGEPYGPGFFAFEDLLQEWREQGDMKGLQLGF
jgi:cyclohexanone monooxygenase